jgi:hypothetical protein
VELIAQKLIMLVQNGMWRNVAKHAKALAILLLQVFLFLIVLVVRAIIEKKEWISL